MPQFVHFQVDPKTASVSSLLQEAVAQYLSCPVTSIQHIQVLKRSIDARKRKVVYNLRLEVFFEGEKPINNIESPVYGSVQNQDEVVIIGAGPAGLFAALKCIEMGVKPIVYERGKDVRERRRDLVAINRYQQVNEDSNYCFGEGGAGTYSDGKLYTRSKKRGDVQRVLSILVHHGASADILVDAHPHIGTNKLPAIIATMRETILKWGGEVHFNQRVTDLKIQNSTLTAIELNNDNWKPCRRAILATGHSARDVFTLLHKHNVAIEAKPFAMGVRIEHPQSLIDSIQYHCSDRGAYLPPAAYRLVTQANGRGVYSFCMCPGGIIAPCATAPGEIVTNGWSPSKRNHSTANSGIVVELRENDFQAYQSHGPLAGVAFQQEIEQRACTLTGGGQQAPAQRLLDFLAGRISETLPPTSYLPGTVSVDLHALFPRFITDALKVGLADFGNKMRGFLHKDAVLLAPESRTSSPVRIPRNPETLEHTAVHGLYPCGEGAGYAGGIVSAAIDGEKCAAMACEVSYNKKVK